MQHCGYTPADAQDLVQGFFSHLLLVLGLKFLVEFQAFYDTQFFQMFSRLWEREIPRPLGRFCSGRRAGGKGARDTRATTEMP